MSLLDLDFSDSLESSVAPTAGVLEASALQQFASDAAFVTAKGSAAADGDIYYNTTDDQVRFFDGNTSSWKAIIGNDGTATNANHYTLSKETTANISALSRDQGALYFDTTLNKPVFDDGTDVRSFGGGGGAAAQLFLSTANPPLEAISDGVELLDYDDSVENSVNLVLKVPSTYTAGTQIKLVGGAFATTATTGDVFFKTITNLIEPGSSVLGSLSNSHTSTNSEVSVSGTGSEITLIGDLDLTDGSGEINSVAVAAGDILAVELKRDIASESVTATAAARLLRNSFEIEGLS